MPQEQRLDVVTSNFVLVLGVPEFLKRSNEYLIIANNFDRPYLKYPYGWFESMVTVVLNKFSLLPLKREPPENVAVRVVISGPFRDNEKVSL